MVENKHSINTILSFGAKSVNPKILEQLLTGRNNTADFLENKVKSIVENGDNQFILVIGQRGMGKTHLLKVLHSRIWHYSQENKLTISYFAEEEYGVANFFDFLLRILNSFIKWYEEDSGKLKKELEKLQETSSANQLNYLEKIIKEYVGNKPLLIITENFGDILDQMGQEEQGRLRAWLYENNNISIIASSQSVSDNFDREDRPFYGFFTPYYLKSLSFEESYDFLISLAEIEKNDKLIKHLKTKGKPQVRAIFDLVKGNHRLLVTFYHFLKTDMLAKVSEVFIKTINDLKPYYETYIRYLPAQQQKILRYIALSRKPQLGVEISKNCFIEQKSLSKQLSELNKKRLVDIIPDPSDKRNKFYDISEPLLRISIEVGEHKEGITALFIDFLALYYNIEELVNRNTRFAELLNNCNTEEEKDIKYEIEAINKALSIKAETVKDSISKISKSITDGNYTKAKEIYFSNISENENEFNIIIASYLHVLKRYEEALKYFKTVEENSLSILGEEIITKSNFYKQLSNTLMNVYLKNKDNDLLEEVVNITLYEYENTGEILNEFIFSRILQIINLIENKEDSKAKEIVSEIIRLDFNNYPDNYKYIIQEYVTYLWKGEEKKYTKNYIKYVNKLSPTERIRLYETLAEESSLNNLYTLNEIIQRDISKINLDKIISKWIINILTHLSLDEFDVNFLLKFTEQNKELIELTISQIYLNTYQEVILNKNESALYELPKEQREFFEKNILKK